VARKRFNVEGIVGIVAEGVSYLLDALVDSMLKVNESLLAPKLLLNFFTGDSLASLAGEQTQKFQGLRRQLDDGARFAQLFGIEI